MDSEKAVVFRRTRSEGRRRLADERVIAYAEGVGFYRTVV